MYINFLIHLLLNINYVGKTSDFSRRKRCSLNEPPCMRRTTMTRASSGFRPIIGRHDIYVPNGLDRP